MTIAQNKAVALAFLKTLAAGKPDTTLLCDDASWWVPGIGEVDRTRFFGMVDAFVAMAAGPMAMEIVAVTAEADRVAVEANGEALLKDGRTYANTYHFLFYLRDGKVLHAREHNDSAVPAALFGNAFDS